MIARGIIPAALLWPCLAWGAITPVIRPYLEIGGKEVPPAAVRMSQTASRITAHLRAPKDGVYNFGLSISAPEMIALQTAQKSYSCPSLAEPLVIHYPYDWTRTDAGGNILSSRPRLVMPGLTVDGRLYLADTHELFSIKLEPCAQGNLRAVLLMHRFFNNGADRATPELHLHAGETRDFTVRIYKDINAANRERFGEINPVKRGNMTEVSFLEYAERSATENDTFFGNSGKSVCCRGLTAEEWELAARKMQPVMQHVIIREQKSSSWIPPIFHKRGMLVYHYQYLGALRRWTPEVTPQVERDFAMRDTKGQVFASPHSPDGNWLQVDVRRPEVRALLVENARAAVRSGWDGIFLDGYPFWADATGNVGGNAPSATESWANARWKLLREMKQAMRAQNPKATLGILTNEYFDTLGFADWGMKEFMYGSWLLAKTSSGNDVVGHYRPAIGSQIRPGSGLVYEEQVAPYQPGPVVYGAKGFSPIAVQSMYQMIRHPSGLYYVDCGTFPIADLDKWLDTIVSLLKQNDLYITDIEPATCAIGFEGAATMSSERRCAVKFNRPVCIGQLPGIKNFTLEPGVHYNVSRECSNSDIR